MPISCGSRLLETQIRDLEQEFSVHFPDDYRDFLSSYNGFVVKQPDFCELDCDAVDDEAIAFYALFGVSISNKNNEVRHQNKQYIDDIGFVKNAFIIGSDPGGNYFVLVCEGGVEGVYYWDRTHLHAEDEKQLFDIHEKNESGNLYKIHNEFKDFFREILKNTLDVGMDFNRDL